MKRFFILFLAVFLLAGCGKTAVSADQIRENIIDEVVSYHPGTAGSSLKQAAAAANVLRAFSDYDSVSGVFEDAGAGEIMKTALAQADAEKDWNALHTVIETVLSRS